MRFGIEALPAVDAELSEHLSVTTMPAIKGQERDNCFKVQIVARPIDGLEGRAETGCDNRVPGKGSAFRTLLVLIELQVIRDVR